MTNVPGVERTVVFDGLVNARDLGGLRRAGGLLTPRGVFYRSENVDGMTAAGWDAAHAANIRTVVDLRHAAERDRDRSARPAWVTTMCVDLAGLDNREFWQDYWDNGLVSTALCYLPHLRAMPERSVEALSAIVSAPAGGVLFHCVGGRDRTGLIAMILLAAAAVHPDDIVADYVETDRRGPLPRADRSRHQPDLDSESLCRRHGTTTEGAMRAALHGLDVDEILNAGGMSGADRNALMTWRGTLPASA